jgi:ribonuclease HI
MNNNFIFYTDGACSQNSKLSEKKNPGAFGVIGYKDTTQIITYSEFYESTTSNRMELLGVLWVIKNCDFNKLVIYSDSQYVVNGFNIWRHNWIKKNWRTAGNQEVLNLDIWLDLNKYSANKNIQLEWIRGHNNNYYNDLVDALARKTILSKVSTNNICDTIKDQIKVN